jgi:aryl-alcohol dehydrogenase-like predicted oxidoreductase
VAVSTLALAWVLHQPRVDAAVIGPRTPAHLDAALAALTLELSADDVGRIGAPFAVI